MDLLEDVGRYREKWMATGHQTKVSESLVFVDVLFGCTQGQGEMGLKSLTWILNSLGKQGNCRNRLIKSQWEFCGIGDLLPRTSMKGAKKRRRWQDTLSCSITDTEIVADGYIHWSRHWLSGMQLVKHRALLLGEATFPQVGKEILLLTEIFGKREEFFDWLPLSYAFIAQWIWEEAAACHLKQLAQSQVLVISRRVPEKPLA